MYLDILSLSPQERCTLVSHSTCNMVQFLRGQSLQRTHKLINLITYLHLLIIQFHFIFFHFKCYYQFSAADYHYFFLHYCFRYCCCCFSYCCYCDDFYLIEQVTIVFLMINRIRDHYYHHLSRHYHFF